MDGGRGILMAREGYSWQETHKEKYSRREKASRDMSMRRKKNKRKEKWS